LVPKATNLKQKKDDDSIFKIETSKRIITQIQDILVTFFISKGINAGAKHPKIVLAAEVPGAPNLHLSQGGTGRLLLQKSARSPLSTSFFVHLNLSFILTV
jgi:hypothetical protein